MLCNHGNIYRLAGVNFLPFVNMKYCLTLNCFVNLSVPQRFLSLFLLPLHVEVGHEAISEEP